MAKKIEDKVRIAAIIADDDPEEIIASITGDPRAVLAGIFSEAVPISDSTPHVHRIFDSPDEIFKNKTIRAICISPKVKGFEEIVRRCISRKIHVLFLGDPADRIDGWDVIKERTSKAGLKWVIGIPALFSKGFLKWYTVLGRDQTGKTNSIRISLQALTPSAGTDEAAYIKGLLGTPMYIIARTAGASLHKATAERIHSACTPKWLSWNAIFEDGLHAAVEISEPASKHTHGRLRLTAYGEEGEVHWEVHDGHEHLRFQRQEFIRNMEVGSTAPESIAIRSFLDFIERDIEPFAPPALLLKAQELCKRVAADLARPALPRNLKILFINPPRYRTLGDKMHAPSLGTARMTAYLREFGFSADQEDLDIIAAENKLDLDVINNHEAIKTCITGQDPTPKISELLKKFGTFTKSLDYDVVGFSIVDFYQRFQLDFSLLAAWWLKKRKPGIKIVFGGVADEIRPRETLTDYSSIVDFVIEGDGETAMLELCNAIEFDDRPFKHIDNLDFKSAGILVRNKQELLPLKNRPCPTFDGVPLELYKKSLSPELALRLKEDGHDVDTGKKAFYLPYYNIKGCAYKCIFCGFGNFLDMQKPEKTVRELRELSQRYGTRYFMFWNTTINMTYKYCNDFCHALIDSGLNLLWTDSARPQFFDPQLAGKMARAGCILLNFGLESGSDKMLGIINKGFSASDAEAALKATHQAGIMNRVNLIAGFFHETPDDVELTRDFLNRNSEYVDMIGCFNGFYLNEGILLDEEVIKIKLLDRKDTIFTGQESLTYNEIGGYEWPQKKEAIRYSRETILKTIREKNIFYEMAICEYDLFLLYDHFRDIEKVKKYLFAATVKGTV